MKKDNKANGPRGNANSDKNTPKKQNTKTGAAARAGSREKYPGYPHYPSSQDIMSQNSGMERLRVSGENFTPSNRADGHAAKNGPGKAPSQSEHDNEKQSGTSLPVSGDDDVSDDEKQMLDAIDQSSPATSERLYKGELDKTDDDGDALNENEGNEQFGGDLDVPGSEDDDAMEDIGEEDEENNYYSLGRDNNDNLEESEDR